MTRTETLFGRSHQMRAFSKRFTKALSSGRNSFGHRKFFPRGIEGQGCPKKQIKGWSRAKKLAVDSGGD